MCEISVLTLPKYVDLATRKRLNVKLRANCIGKIRQTEHVVYRSGGFWVRTDDIIYYSAEEIIRVHDYMKSQSKINARIKMADWTLLRDIVKSEIKLTLKATK